MLRFYRVQVQVQSISRAGAKVQRRRGSAEVVVSRGSAEVQSRYRAWCRAGIRCRAGVGTGAEVQVQVQKRGAETQVQQCRYR